MATQQHGDSQTNDAMKRLWKGVPGKLATLPQKELFRMAALLLDEQGRVDDVIASASTPLFGIERHELFWVALFPYLRDCGYRLRARYAPGWRYTGSVVEGAWPRNIRDGFQGSPVERDEYARDPNSQPLSIFAFRTIHAICEATNEDVVIKVLCSEKGRIGSKELEILRFLNEEHRRSHPHNHCVPVSAFLDFPATDVDIPSSEFSFVVMPALQDVKFGLRDCLTRAFALNLFQQAVEGVAYLHSLGIVHRDISQGNVMTTTGGPPHKLYLIDFGLARRVNPVSPQAHWIGGRWTPPEINSKEFRPSYDPYKVDVYNVARLFSFLLHSRNDGFKALAARMEEADPEKRCAADEALQACRQLMRSLPPWQAYRFSPHLHFIGLKDVRRALTRYVPEVYRYRKCRIA
ncbi:kinase-like protein [Exidia glandulosa HHB12029]|uniref:Kinase-like protein n=1 Tax=Exidia glandulosa HHB12029 TaxID=1314781 RepID=A0A166A3R3_EXIGL|nr:kinase-like protein [Exidia glandulosa HHB12029]